VVLVRSDGDGIVTDCHVELSSDFLGKSWEKLMEIQNFSTFNFKLIFQNSFNPPQKT
jgi:hypothetical protein